MTATKEDSKQTIAYAKLLLSKETPVNTIENQLESSIAEIRSLVGEVLEYESTGRLSPILAKAHKMLTLKGIDSSIASDIVQSIGIDATSSKEEIRKQLSQQLVRRMPRAVPPPSRESLDSIVIALVGPTGVGKTTTIAKLATKFRLQQGRSVALITADTYRVAAVEQLQQYANLFDSTLAIAGTSQQMSEAIESCNSADIVLIDTAGRSAMDDDRIQETAAILQVARPNETHLVLSAATSRTATKRAVDGFSITGYDRIIVSKLDEADSYGEMVSTLCDLRKPLSWFTNGQDISTHIDMARPDALVDSLWE